MSENSARFSLKDLLSLPVPSFLEQADDCSPLSDVLSSLGDDDQKIAECIQAFLTERICRQPLVRVAPVYKENDEGDRGECCAFDVSIRWLWTKQEVVGLDQKISRLRLTELDISCQEIASIIKSANQAALLGIV